MMGLSSAGFGNVYAGRKRISWARWLWKRENKLHSSRADSLGAVTC
jgi:hypothetical protein